MKKALVLFSLLAGFSFTHGLIGEKLSPNAVPETASLISESFAWVRTLLTKAEVAPVPPVSLTNQTSTHTNWAALITNLSVSGASNFVVDSIYYDLPSLTVFVNAHIPNLTIAGQHKVNGTASGSQVSGKGAFDILVNNITCSLKAKLGVVTATTMRVNTMTLSYNIGSLQVNAPDLRIDNVSPELVNEHMSKMLLAKVQTDIPRIPKVLAGILKITFNTYISGKTLPLAKFRIKKYIKTYVFPS